MLNWFKSFFGAASHRSLQAAQLLIERVPEATWDTAIKNVKTMEGSALDNVARRKYVVTALMQIPGMTESWARILSDLALQLVRQGLDTLTDQAAGQIKGKGV